MTIDDRTQTIAKWAGRAFVVVLWLAVAVIGLAAYLSEGHLGWLPNLIAALFGLAWILAIFAIGPIVWYVTEPLPKRES